MTDRPTQPLAYLQAFQISTSSDIVETSVMEGALLMLSASQPAENMTGSLRWIATSSMNRLRYQNLRRPWNWTMRISSADRDISLLWNRRMRRRAIAEPS